MGFMFGGAPTGRISAWVLSFRFTVNSKPPVTVMCSVEPSRLALVIGLGVLSSDGSARSRLPSSLSAMRDSVTDPVKPEPLRTKIMVAKLLPSNIQCHVPANFSEGLGDSEPACRLTERASTEPPACYTVQTPWKGAARRVSHRRGQ